MDETLKRAKTSLKAQKRMVELEPSPERHETPRPPNVLEGDIADAAFGPSKRKEPVKPKPLPGTAPAKFPYEPGDD